MHTKFWSENLNGRDHIAYLGVDGKIILDCIIGELREEVWNGFIWLSIGSSPGCYEHIMILLVLQKAGNFLTS